MPAPPPEARDAEALMGLLAGLVLLIVTLLAALFK